MRASKTFPPPSSDVVDHILASMSHLEGTTVADLANVFLVCKDLTRTPRLVDSMMHASLGFNNRIVKESLRRACDKKNAEVVRLLLKEHGGVEVIASAMLHCAQQKDDFVDILRVLLQHGGVEAIRYAKNCIDFTIYEGGVEILRVLLQHGAVEVRPDMLVYAIIRDRVDIVRVLLELGGAELIISRDVLLHAIFRRNVEIRLLRRSAAAP